MWNNKNRRRRGRSASGLPFVLVAMVVGCDDERSDPLGIEAEAAPVALTTATDSAFGVARALAWLEGGGPSGLIYEQHNSSGGTNSITVLGTGYYEVRMPGLAGLRGVAHTDGHACRPERWNSSGTDLLIRVECTQDTGTRVHEDFALLYYKEARTDTQGAYLWANQPSAASYTPSSNYQWNSSGAVNQVQRLGPGRYEVTLPGVRARPGNGGGGSVMVSAYGSGAGHCKVENWSSSLWSDTRIRVRCYSGGHTLVDRRFTLSFVTDAALGSSTGSTGTHGGYLWRNHSGGISSGPATPMYSYNTKGATNSVGALGTLFDTNFPELEPFDSAVTIVTAYGMNADRCFTGSREYFTYSPVGPGSGTNVNVLCENPLSGSGDFRFTALHLTDELR